MAERQPRRDEGLYVSDDQPLVGVVREHDGHDVTHYFVEEDTDGSSGSERTPGQALQLIGAWNDLDWDEVAAELDRIRHESPPSPPLDV